MLIPKTIHYCWFGNKPLPVRAKNCLKSWSVFFPEHEIKLWNEKNFNVKITKYTEQAYAHKKYAFVSDYARFWIIYHYGGIYFDTDVEVIKPMKDVLDIGGFMGCEINGGDVRENVWNRKGIAVAPGLGIGNKAGSKIYGQILKFYEDLNFINDDESLNITTVVHYTTEILKENGLKDINGIQKIDDITIYPAEYFCPIDVYTRKLMNMTENTRTIHYFDASWQSKRSKIRKKLEMVLGERMTSQLTYILNLYRKIK